MGLKIHFLWWLALFTLIAFWLRWMGTGMIPAGISHDELDYYLGGKFIALTGNDMSGNWKWWPPTPMKTGTITAESAALFYVPLAFLRSGLQTAKLTPAIIGSFMVPLMFGLLYILSRGNTTLGLAGAGLMAINPWHIVYSRTGFEVTLALFAYTSSLVLFWSSGYLKKITKRKILLVAISLFLFALGYYSYHGFKFIAPFIAMVLTFGRVNLFTSDSKDKRWSLINLAPLILTIGLLVSSLLHAPDLGERRGELIMLSPHLLSEAVDKQRRLSLLPVMANFMENKYTQMLRHMTTTYLGFYSLDRLFFSADDGFNLRFSVHGYFYAFEILLIIWGITMSLKKRRFWLLGLLLLLAPLPSAIHVGQSYGIRSMLAIVPLIGFSAIGFVSVWEKAREARWRFLVVGVVGISLINFLYVYWGSFSVVSADQYMINHRLLSSYVSRLPSGIPKTIVSPEPYGIFRQVLFYADLVDARSVQELQTQFSTLGIYDDFRFEGILVTSDCSAMERIEHGVLIVDSGYEKICTTSRTMRADSLGSRGVMALGSPIDSRDYYRIYGDVVCQKGILPRYVHLKDLKSLAVEQLSDNDFCITWSFQAL
jgi:hypothetical protein